jgi:hypothetical protein
MKFKKAFWWAFFVVFLVSVFVNSIVGFLELGVLLIGISLNGIFSLKRIQRKGIECPGRIAYIERGDEGERTPIVEFTSIRNDNISGKPYMHSSGDLNYRNSKGKLTDLDVTVVYLADKPERFVILDEISFSYLSLSIAGVAGGAIIITCTLGLLGYFD